MARYIDADALEKVFKDGVRVYLGRCDIDDVICNIADQPTADVVAKDVYDQVAWERDIAVGQLAELGLSLGQKAKVSENRRRTTMKKSCEKPIRKCEDCVHENACKAWTNGRAISDESASRCPNYETARMSAAYLVGRLDGKQEAAREIFNEINEVKDKYAGGEITGDVMHVCLFMLEKKYVRRNNDD